MKRYRRTFVIFVILQLLLTAGSNVYSAAKVKEDERIQYAASSFNEIIELWYDKKFDILYDKFVYVDKSALSKEKFVNRMTNEKQRLACCWQKVQDVKVKLHSLSKAVVSVKLGFEGQFNEVSFVNAEVPLYLKDEGWKINVKDIFAASPDLTKNKKRSIPKKTQDLKGHIKAYSFTSPL